MNTADQIFQRIREELEKSELSLHKLVAKADVNYHRLYRFRNGTSDLTLEDAEKMYIMFTGSSFIAPQS